MIDRAAPADVESERALLSCVLIDPSLVLLLAPLEKHSFWLEKNQVVWDAIQQLTAAGDSVDLITVTHALTEMKTLEIAGGSAYLMSLLADAGSVSSVETYYKNVVTAALRRKLLIVSTHIAGLAYDSQGKGAEELLAESNNLMASLYVTDSSSSSSFEELLQGVETHFEEIFSSNVLRGISTGLIDLDGYTGGMQRGDLWIAAGDPGVGKTSLAMTLMTSAGQSEHRTLFFSLEMEKDRLMERWVAVLADTSISSIRKMSSGEKQNLLSRLQPFKQFPIFIDTRPQDTGTIRTEVARFEKKVGKLDLVIVDYSRLLRDKIRGDNEVLRIEQISRNLKNLSKEFGLTTLLIHGLVKAAFGRRPTLQDLGWSHQMAYDVDVCILPWYNRNRTDKMAEIYIGKQRNGVSNVPVPCVFDESKTIWRSLAKSTAGQQGGLL